MIKKNTAGKVLAVFVLCASFIMPQVQALARDRNDRGSHNNRGHYRSHEVVVVGRDRYHYRDGRFYRPGWFGIDFIVTVPPFGAVVASIPAGHRRVIVGGVTYYTCNNVYYSPSPSGYIVVPPPIIPPQAAVICPEPAHSSETLIVYIPNARGSYTPVTLVKSGSGYVGPQGEYYHDHPTVDQLKVLYGK